MKAKSQYSILQQQFTKNSATTIYNEKKETNFDENLQYSPSKCKLYSFETLYTTQFTLTPEWTCLSTFN